ncbi:sensor histidine kinase [Aquipuribacter sp. MA13-6]|uniref:sensor histidine kinase n=1 Tax=unclassified Aquipuribacter TaxID=2635084 RepID=UPI003EED065E
MRRYLAVSGVVLLAVGVPTAVALSTVAHELATAAAIERADRFADRVVGPMLAPEPTGTAAEVGAGALDRVVAARLADGSMDGVRVWDHDGLLLYSAGEAPGETAEVVSLDVAHEGDAVFEGTEQVRVLTAADVGLVDPLAVEVLVPRDEVLRVEQRLRWPFVLAGMLGLLALTTAQLPLAISMAKRVQDVEQSRRMLLAQAVAASELERRRLAQQLHDDVIQDLAGLGYSLDSIARHLPQAQRGPVVAARELLQSDVTKLRDILADVYPSQVAHAQLLERLDALAATLRQDGTDVVLDVDIAAPLDVGRATLLHRVAREALTNVGKHADAGRVRVTVRHSGRGTELRVRDDGRGFETGDGEAYGHVGLRLVHDLVQEFDGALRVVSEPDAGTVVSLRLPPPR